MNNGHEDVCFCPSFNSYSSDRLAEMAVRVAGERPSDNVDNGTGDDFEFALVRDHKQGSATDCHIGPVFPVFNRDLYGGAASTSGENKQLESESSAEISLSQLFIAEDNEHDCPPSCSSSEADELESVPTGTYCVWRPSMAEPPLPSQCRKSKSTGSRSKRWKLRELLRRSKSAGKESFAFLTTKHRDKLVETSKRGSGSAGAGAPTSAHEAFYVRNRAIKEGEKKKSYLPYRQDLVGLFANVNGMRRSFPHF